MKKLTELEVQPLSRLQMNLFTRGSVRAYPNRLFNLSQVFVRILQQKDRAVMSIDVNGDKLVSTVFRVHDGVLQSKTVDMYQSDHGRGYLKRLEEIAAYTGDKKMPVGISFAGAVDDSKAISSPNLLEFFDEFHTQYKSDFARLFPTYVCVLNDALTGMIASAVEMKKIKPDIKNIIYIINGSGIGASVLDGDTIISTEAGHIQLLSQLNTYNVTEKCGLFGNNFVCIEKSAAGKAALEPIWKKLTGREEDGVAISKAYQNGDERALELFNTSSFLVAHIAAGIASAFGKRDVMKDTAFVFHGGIFHVPYYGERVEQLLSKELGGAFTVLFTKDFSAHASSDGAAIAALTAL